MFRAILISLVVVAAIAALVLRQRSIDVPSVSGIIEAQDIRVGSRVGGRCAEVRVREGDRVKQGDMLVRFEPYDLMERLAEAEMAAKAGAARLEMMRAGNRPEELAAARAARDRALSILQKLEAGPRPLEVQMLRDRVAAAAAELPKAQNDFDRISELVKQGIGSRDELIEKTRALDVVKARSDVARHELMLAEEGTRQEDIGEARANLAKAEAELALFVAGFRSEEIARTEAETKSAESRVAAIRKQIDELQVLAPCAGVVEAIDLRPGDLVAPGAPVATLIDNSEMWIRAYVPERYTAIVPGATLPVRLSAAPDRALRGEVVYVSREAEFSPANVQTPEERSKQVFRIKVVLREAAEYVRAGMTADVLLTPGR